VYTGFMNIIFNPQKLSLSDRFRQRIQTKFDQGLGKLLVNYQEDLKVASLAIEKVARSGYEIKFDMNLPGCPINIRDSHRVLMDGVIRVRNQAKRQIKKYLEKMRGY
jgi:ribosome-associated translation inhibitor RaiA